MKAFITLAFLFVTAVIVYAQPPDVPATPGSTYGSKINPTGAHPVAELPQLLKDSQPHDVKVMGTVTDVCPKMGCWMKVEMPDKSAVFVNMKDYGFFVPVALKGKNVVIDGQASKVITSVDQLKHYAEDAKKSKEEIAAIKEPKEEIQLTASGIVVVN